MLWLEFIIMQLLCQLYSPALLIFKSLDFFGT